MQVTPAAGSANNPLSKGALNPKALYSDIYTAQKDYFRKLRYMHLLFNSALAPPGKAKCTVNFNHIMHFFS